MKALKGFIDVTRPHSEPGRVLWPRAVPLISTQRGGFRLVSNFEPLPVRP
jgi:hypothetical protein